MPAQQVIFETPSESVLEVRTSGMVTAVVSDRIPCIRLRTAGVESIGKTQASSVQTKKQPKAHSKRRKRASETVAKRKLGQLSA